MRKGGCQLNIRIEQSEGFGETEVLVKCDKELDHKTKALLRQLELFDRTVLGQQDGESYRVPLTEILYIESVDEKTFLYLADAVYEAKGKLYEWESLLQDSAFVRISKAAILNTDKLKSVHPLLSGKLEVTLSNGEKQVVNRHYVAAFRRVFGI